MPSFHVIIADGARHGRFLVDDYQYVLGLLAETGLGAKKESRHGEQQGESGIQVPL
jgi:hypothetical protein